MHTHKQTHAQWHIHAHALTNALIEVSLYMYIHVPFIGGNNGHLNNNVSIMTINHWPSM